jgi:uncharacterized membrane protein YkoI
MAITTNPIGGHDMSSRCTLTMMSVVAGLAIASTVMAQEKKLTRAQLPPAVEKTVAEQSKGATIRGLSTEIDNGKKVYEASLTVNGHARDVSIDEQGNVLEIEDQVTLASLPPAVRNALTKAAGAGKIEKVESLSKRGKLVAYEAAVKTGTKRSEIQVGPDGQKLAHPE